MLGRKKNCRQKELYVKTPVVLMSGLFPADFDWLLTGEAAGSNPVRLAQLKAGNTDIRHSAIGLPRVNTL